MTLFYLVLALAIAVGINAERRWWRLAAQLLAVAALALMGWSIWLANVDATFSSRPAADWRPLLLNAMGVVCVGAVALLVALLPAQWRRDVVTVPMWNERQRWGQLARLLHWASAVLILAALPIGLFVTVLAPSPERGEFLAAHVGIGLAVLLLLLLRVVAQALSPGPASPNGAARLNKLALYLLLAALPVSGLALASATGWPVLGWHMPEAVPLQPARQLHQLLSALFALAFAAHAGAVIWHEFFLRDRRLVRRMLR